MASSLPNLSIIFLKEFIELNENTNIMTENVKLVEMNMSIATVFSNTKILKMIIMEYKCLCFNKTYQHKFHEKLKVRFFYGFKISNHDNNKFIVVERCISLCAYLYEYMDVTEKFNETSLLQ